MGGSTRLARAGTPTSSPLAPRVAPVPPLGCQSIVPMAARPGEREKLRLFGELFPALCHLTRRGGGYQGRTSPVLPLPPLVKPKVTQRSSPSAPSRQHSPARDERGGFPGQPRGVSPAPVGPGSSAQHSTKQRAAGRSLPRDVRTGERMKITKSQAAGGAQHRLQVLAQASPPRGSQREQAQPHFTAHTHPRHRESAPVGTTGGMRKGRGGREPPPAAPLRAAREKLPAARKAPAPALLGDASASRAEVWHADKHTQSLRLALQRGPEQPQVTSGCHRCPHSSPGPCQEEQPRRPRQHLFPGNFCSRFIPCLLELF